MIKTILDMINNKHNFWRELFKYLFLFKFRNEKLYFSFRSRTAKYFAINRDISNSIRKIDLNSLFPYQPGIVFLQKIMPYNEYNVDNYELSILSALVAYKKPKLIFEFGTFDGRTTYQLALNSDNDAKIYSIDIQYGNFDFGKDARYFENIEVGYNASSSELKSKIELLKGDSLRYDFSAYYNKCDFIFIDADHSFNSVMSDSRNALKMLKKDGIIIWHDYLNISDVTSALLEISKTITLKKISGTTLVIFENKL